MTTVSFDQDEHRLDSDGLYGVFFVSDKVLGIGELLAALSAKQLELLQVRVVKQLEFQRELDAFAARTREQKLAK